MNFGLMRELQIGQRFPGVIVSYVVTHTLYTKDSQRTPNR